MPRKLEVGHILKSSWGYDQTNVDFYQVVELVGTKSVKIVKLGYAAKDYDTSMSGKVLPGEPIAGTEMVKRVSGYNGTSVAITSYASAYLWEGTPAFFSEWA